MGSISALLPALLACVIAQSLKIFTHWQEEKKCELKKAFSSGGMPSSHSATVMCLTGYIGLDQGLSSETFAISLVLSLIVMYDATGVRLQAGRQAQVLNTIITDLPLTHPVHDCKFVLRDSIGHSPLQVVAGAALGLLVAAVSYLIAVGLH